MNGCPLDADICVDKRGRYYAVCKEATDVVIHSGDNPLGNSEYFVKHNYKPFYGQLIKW